MALTKTIQKEIYGKTMEIENTYIKICQFHGTKEQIEIEVNTFAENRNSLIENDTFFYKPSVADGAENFIKQGYEYLKTLPEFENAIDC